MGAGWVPTDRVLNTFDANGKLTSTENQVWAATYWSNVDSNVLTYDNVNNVVLRESLKWSSGSYTQDKAVRYSYIATATPTGYSIATQTALTWDSGNNVYRQWTDDDSTHFYYDTVPLGIKTNSATISDIRIYPVPTGDFVNLQMPSTGYYNAMLVDMNGKLVKMYSGLAAAAHRLDLQDVPNGNYMLHIDAGGKVATQKLVVAR